MTSMKLKQFMFSFEGGGWNTVWAKTRKGAVKEATRKYFGSGLKPIPSSVHLATEDGLRSALALFY